MAYELLDCRPVPAALAAEIKAIKEGAGNPALTSCLRTQDAVDYARARGCALSSQAELYRDFLNGVGNPANPPGFSTHELRSDGVAFAWITRGLPLRYWMVGQDWGDGATALRVCDAARRRGWTCTVTYPTNPRELHHVNFRKEPKLVLFRPLRVGSKGPRVQRLTWQLQFLHRPGGHDEPRYLPDRQWRFDAKVAEAVRLFQHDHHQAVDGIVGKHTLRQLAAAVRLEKRRREIWKLKAQLVVVEGDLLRLRAKREGARERLRDPDLDDRTRRQLEAEVKDTDASIARNLRDSQKLRERIRKLGGDPGPRPGQG